MEYRKNIIDTFDSFIFKTNEYLEKYLKNKYKVIGHIGWDIYSYEK